MPKNQKTNDHFEGFEHKTDAISRYLYSQATGLFSIALKNSNRTVHFTPEQPEAFKQWLDSHNIMDVNTTF